MTTLSRCAVELPARLPDDQTAWITRMIHCPFVTEEWVKIAFHNSTHIHGGRPYMEGVDTRLDVLLLLFRHDQILTSIAEDVKLMDPWLGNAIAHYLASRPR